MFLHFSTILLIIPNGLGVGMDRIIMCKELGVRVRFALLVIAITDTCFDGIGISILLGIVHFCVLWGLGMLEVQMNCGCY
jgi:hypothetical protein